MIVIIRIAGMVKKHEDVKNTLDRLRLRRKYACVIIKDSKENKGMVQKVRSYTAYGKIDEKTLTELIEKRAELRPENRKGKLDAKKVASEILKNKNLNDLEIKPFFRLHPARGGIDSKQHFPQGVLGDHKEKINDLIRRML